MQSTFQFTQRIGLTADRPCWGQVLALQSRVDRANLEADRAEGRAHAAMAEVSAAQEALYESEVERASEQEANGQLNGQMRQEINATVQHVQDEMASEQE